MDELSLRALMCDIGRMMWQRGLVGATEGNLSVRLSPRRILCTPAGTCKGRLRPSDLVVIDPLGAAVGDGIPSTEIAMHVRCYAVREDCQAVVHAHPLVATGFALAGEEIPDDLLPEAAAVLGSVATVPFALPGTTDLPDALEPLLADHKTFLLANHGALALGKDLMDAYNRMETLERVAAIIQNARSIGNPNPIARDSWPEIAKTITGSV